MAGGRRRRKARDRPQGSPVVVNLHVSIPDLALRLPAGQDATDPSPPASRVQAAGEEPLGGPTWHEEPSRIPDFAPLDWPVGPHYLRWVDGKGSAAWARYKLKAADWYLETLAATERQAGRIDRYVGVEMALDGVLASLCAGVDAAGSALLASLGRLIGLGADDPSERLEGDWPAAFELAETAGLELASSEAATKALRGDGTDQPAGWLARLRLLRIQAVRQNVLVRGLVVDGAPHDRLLQVPGRGQRPVIPYLKKARRRAGELVELLIGDTADLAGLHLGVEARPPRARTTVLPNLAARADLLGRVWPGPPGG